MYDREPQFDLRGHPHDHRGDRRQPDLGRDDSRISEIHAELIERAARRVGDEFRKQLPPHDDKCVAHYAFDLNNLTGTQSGTGQGVGTGAGLYIANMPGKYTIRGAYVENKAASQCAVGVWLHGTTDGGTPFFTCGNGSYKGYPVNAFENCKQVAIALVSGTVNAQAIVRVLLFSYELNPRQGSAV